MNVLRIDADLAIEPLGESLIFNDITFDGDWRTMGAGGIGEIRFDFFADAWSVPNRLEAYFVTTGGDMWLFELPSVVPGWNTYGVRVDVRGAWYSL